MNGGYRAAQSPFSFTISADVAAKIMGEDGKDFFNKLKAGQLAPKVYPAQVELGYSKTTNTTQVSNVLALLEGTDKKMSMWYRQHTTIILVKRNDTVINGADDDGSGTTGILELAEAFAKAKRGKGPRKYPIHDSERWRKRIVGNNIIQSTLFTRLIKHLLTFNIDMIGRIGTEYLKDKDSTNYVYIIGDDKLSTDLAPITDMVNNTYMKMKLDRKYNDPKDPNPSTSGVTITILQKRYSYHFSTLTEHMPIITGLPIHPIKSIIPWWRNGHSLYSTPPGKWPTVMICWKGILCWRNRRDSDGSCFAGNTGLKI